MPKLKKKKTPKQLKVILWNLCKELTRKLYGRTCYTCGNYCESPHTGHFISSSVCSGELRYSLDNLRPQCYRCNIHLSGNWLAYEEKLIKENGKEWVEALKKRNQETKGQKFDEIFYQAKIDEYEKLLQSK